MPRRLADAARITAIAGLLAVMTVASHRGGVPADLPEVALDWRILFHIERAAALLATVGLVVLVGWRALRGELPTKLGQVEYRVERASADSKAATEELENRVAALEAVIKASFEGRKSNGGRD
jgi:hypothetical protein